MKKTISLLLIITILLPFFSVDTFSENDEGYFVVTAYYSPLPNQETYLTGDYTSEKRLNGQGIRGASGKEVFSGMLAAPKNYAFGTKIYIEGLGVGEVADRGGAIVNAGKRGYEHDRLDVWVGSGDEGLKRALYWGKRKVKGRIVESNSNISLDYNIISSPNWATNGLRKISNVFNVGLGKGSDVGMVKKLQKLLSEVGLYNGEIDGIYNNNVIDVVYNFQLENDIVQKQTDYGAGYWGKNTRDLFLKEYLNGDINNKPVVKDNKPITRPQDTASDKFSSSLSWKEATNVEQKKPVVQKVEAKTTDILDRAISGVEDIKNLQTILKEMGLYKGDINGNNKELTNIIYDYQISKGIVTGLNSLGAGNYGPKTRASLRVSYNEFLANKELARLEQVRIQEEAKKAELRKQELEQKYKKLEELSLKKAQEKLATIGSPKFGEVSSNVRNLQLTLKQLGFFDQKDTAIYGEKTKESIFAYQVSRNLVSKKDDLGAGMIGPRTLETLKKDLKSQFLQELAINQGINTKEIAVIVVERM
ncbi:MAG: hypothetical protein Q8K30_00385 [Candidatus Gracilibacteria bacterium]|nr:hypothetical protein [Candidatus Gracilibacteria bacterium]